MSQPKSPALVVLAAGLGSRYGGFKQLDSMSAENESIMELSIRDAIRAGFKKVVLVINRQISQQIDERVVARFQKLVEIVCVFQELDAIPTEFDLPPNRKKPWGTGHAILSAREAIATPFAVINADDFYGTSAYTLMNEALSSMSPDSADYCMLGYLLVNTLSNHGGVSRGLCGIANDHLTSIKEIKNIRRTNDTINGFFAGKPLTLDPDSIVSMNFWGFTPQVFTLLEQRFEVFLQVTRNDPDAEFFITEALDYAITGGLSKVRVLTTAERWYGVTFREDREEVRQGIQAYFQPKKQL
jgi:UTP-glucose-1-phosphate uridylyltransferase